MVESTLEATSVEPPGARAARAHGSVVRGEAGRAPRAPQVAARAGIASAAIAEALQALAADPDSPAAHTPVAEWLLDNTHVLRETRALLKHDMPPAFLRVLPRVADRTDGLRRVEALATSIVAEAGAPIDRPSLETFVEEYQTVATLMTGELWALPAFLRLALLEDLARIAARNVPTSAPGRERGAVRPEAADELRARRAILALRELAGLDWRAFVERASRVEAILCRDPGGSHPNSDFETRDRTRKAVERIARGSGLDEERVASLALEACLEAPGDAKARHVAWWLLGAGRAAFEAKVRYRPPLRALAGRALLAHPVAGYLGGVAAIGLSLLAGLAAFAADRVPVAGVLAALALGLVPAMTVAIALVNTLVTAMAPPRRLPRLDFSEGIPDDARTLVVVPVLLGSAEESRGLLEGLERDHVGNEDDNVAFALLTDFPDADHAQTPQDAEILRVVTDGISALNARHGEEGRGPFLLIHRGRRWNERSGRWMGWERKRGKLHELLGAVLGLEGAGFEERVGDPERLQGVRYVLTRDADAQLPPDCVEQLVATMAHPLNRAVLDEQGRVTDGYAVLQPRLEPSPESARRTPFTRAFAGDRGLDPYATIVSDVHHDLFGEGIYAGKGLLDAAAFHRSLTGRVPTDALLSHDLFEGLHARTGLVSDVVLLEDVPADVPGFLARAHRWIRGDWQLLPWLNARVPGEGGTRHPNRFGVIGRWKVLDNLRRSLLAPSLFALAVAGWTWMPGAATAVTLVVLGTLAAPLLASLLGTIVRWGNGAPAGLALANGIESGRLALVRWGVTVLLLPHEALTAADAIARTLWRLFVSRRGLLEWTPAAHAERALARKGSLAATVLRMGPALLLTAAATALVALAAPASLPAALPLLVAWFASPFVAHRIGRRTGPRRELLDPARRQELRILARRTWLYFERFVGPDDHWLPPDNFQESPEGRVARRTSPTNVGLALLATLGAHDLGYVGPLGFEARLRSAFDALGRLQRHRGHFYNWYETHHLAPLEPRYVSTVDSGNLVASFWALATGCEEVADTRVARPAQREGILDTIDVLRETLERSKAFARATGARAARAALDALRERVDAAYEPDRLARVVEDLSARDLVPVEEHLARLAEESAQHVDPLALGDLRIWTARLRERVTFVHREFTTLAPWLALREGVGARVPGPQGPAIAARLAEILDAMPEDPRLGEVPAACAEAGRRVAGVRASLASDAATAPEALSACDETAEVLRACAKEVATLSERLRALAADARRLAEETDFTFLYDRRRRLLHLGYDATTGRLDPNHYDLLASESRIASLAAIAKGDVPARHWLHLGRPLARLARGPCLKSWSGTMFEYLMPCLLLRTPENTLLGRSCDTAIAEHMEAGLKKGLPWGASESGFAELDAHASYGYRAFGARSLGLKRDTGSRDVVAPYASVLAITRRPGAVLANLERLRELGMVGRYGLYEALDWGPAGTGKAPTTVRSYMAHHEAMILLSLCNALDGDRFVERLRADARIRAFDLLLDERAPVATTEAADAPSGGVPLPTA
ncbi:MAG TPA: glucoamylase family protein, partial [Planctomycetota bacterium]|nr:glucoamylase family protein [Planctomycetota bacterium]